MTDGVVREEWRMTLSASTPHGPRQGRDTGGRLLCGQIQDVSGRSPGDPAASRGDRRRLPLWNC